MRREPNRPALVFLLLIMIGLLISGGGAAEGVEIIKFAVWDYSLSPEYKEAIDVFQKENPGIKVKVIDTSSREYVDKVTVMLAAGEDVDVVAIKDMPSFAGYVTRKQLLPLDAFILRARLDLKDYGGFVGALRVNRRLYGLPYRSDLFILFYNKDIFDRARLPYPGHDMTWGQFREIARRLTSGEGNEKVYGAFVHTWKSMAANPGIARYGGRYSLVGGEYGFLKPVYELLLKMQNEDGSIMSFAEAKTTSAHYRTQFEAGKAGMLYMGTWHIGQLISDRKAGRHAINWGIVRAPRFPDQEPGCTVGLVTPCGINAKSRKAEAAWKFISFLGGEKGAEIFARHGVLPALRTRPILDIYTALDGFPAGGEAALEVGPGLPGVSGTPEGSDDRQDPPGGARTDHDRPEDAGSRPGRYGETGQGSIGRRTLTDGFIAGSALPMHRRRCGGTRAIPRAVFPPGWRFFPAGIGRLARNGRQVRADPRRIGRSGLPKGAGGQRCASV